MTNPQNNAGYAGDITPQQAHDWWQSGEAMLIDIRTNAERAWVGFIPNVAAIEFKIWPGMAINPQYEKQLQAAMLASAPSPPHNALKPWALRLTTS
jgi:sulfur dioxygenase